MADDQQPRHVFAFGPRNDGSGAMRDVLGGKGANLAEMARIGLPVPPGFTISTGVCAHYYEHDGRYPGGLAEAVRDHLSLIERHQGRRFGDATAPLLVSVRSGAAESMPGMMDTILNLGLNDDTVDGLAALTGDRRFAYDCYRRFIHMYGSVVLGVRSESEQADDPFETPLAALKRSAGAVDDADLTAEQLGRLVEQYQSLVESSTGAPFPQDAEQQLWGAIGAVFGSWSNERAVLYRQRYGISRGAGTAVSVQAMVFGNLGPHSATGVAFTRNPATGERELYGEYLVRAQGEDVVAGARTPKPLAELKREMPDIHAELQTVRQRLEERFRDMQDFEFTVEDGRLYLLQTRAAKRTGVAAVRAAVDMQREGLLDEQSALLRIPADSVESLLAPAFDAASLERATEIAQGLPAGPGAASGRVVFSSEAAVKARARGERSILCRIETSPEDLKGMLAADGILTARGGVSSHAALVARQLGKVCVCGASGIAIDYAAGTFTSGGVELREGDPLSLDGTTGTVYAGEVATSPSEVRRVLSGDLAAADSARYRLYETVMGWADRHRRMAVRSNADTPAMAQEAVAFGAEGIGLCRSEHMFFESDRIDVMRRMILAEAPDERRAALDELLPVQRQDYVGLFRAMAGRPVTIRLLDPPLHEFLPHGEDEQAALAQRLGLPQNTVQERIAAMAEVNPMLGWRGCRLGILHPEITEVQARAIFEAGVAVARGDEGRPVPVRPEIMVPLVGFREELADQTRIVRRVADAVMAASRQTIDYQVGTMIEVPRAALAAAELAEEAEFFSFGTNDLTQMTLGLSRDDMHAFYDGYVRKEIYAANPFASLDKQGVGRLITLAAEAGRSSRKSLKLGICGEHGGDGASIAFCEAVGLDYVSCSPLRVPVARLAAAQAALRARSA